jgi:hypothetical protein
VGFFDAAKLDDALSRIVTRLVLRHARRTPRVSALAGATAIQCSCIGTVAAPGRSRTVRRRRSRWRQPPRARDVRERNLMRRRGSALSQQRHRLARPCRAVERHDMDTRNACRIAHLRRLCGRRVYERDGLRGSRPPHTRYRWSGAYTRRAVRLIPGYPSRAPATKMPIAVAPRLTHPQAPIADARVDESPRLNTWDNGDCARASGSLPRVDRCHPGVLIRRRRTNRKAAQPAKRDLRRLPSR